jgi:hypothetical protein
MCSSWPPFWRFSPKIVGFESKTKWKNFTEKLQKWLRDPVAHAQPLPVQEWKEIMKQVEQVEKAIVKIEEYLAEVHSISS